MKHVSVRPWSPATQRLTVGTTVVMNGPTKHMGSHHTIPTGIGVVDASEGGGGCMGFTFPVRVGTRTVHADVPHS